MKAKAITVTKRYNYHETTILTQFKIYYVKYMQLHSMKTDNSVLYRASSF